MYCKKSHALEVCEKIKEQTPKDRIRFLATKGLCFGCLTQGHLSKSCNARSVQENTQVFCMSQRMLQLCKKGRQIETQKLLVR